MNRWLNSIWPGRLSRRAARQGDRADAIWQTVLAHYGFLRDLDEQSRTRLSELSLKFLNQKEFHGAQGLVITDILAMSVAAQACLPLLNIAPPQQALAWYNDFVGIVVHPAEMLARREVTDDAGVVHHFREELSGESMAQGPVTLNWKDVANAGQLAQQGTNLVIHEFAHKLDMKFGPADGCPPLPDGFMGLASDRQARQLWQSTLQSAFESFREQVILAERFGAEPAWLDAYAAHSLPEFFAVACEAYFVNRPRFSVDFPGLMPLFDNFFHRQF